MYVFKGLSFLSHFLSDFDSPRPKVMHSFAHFKRSTLITNTLRIGRNKLHLFLEIL